MSEKKQQNLFVPLRVRFRSLADQTQEEGNRFIRENPLTAEQMHRLMRREFRISQSYFIPHEFSDEFTDIPWAVDMPLANYKPGGWHPEDALIIPLYSLRKRKLLGFLSLDEPEDGKIPSLESIEMIELFANQAAIAIDSARIFQEREAERVILEEAIDLLRRDVEQVQYGDLRVRVQSSHEKLQPVVEAMNIMIKEFSEILGSVQMVTQAVDEHVQDVQRSSEVLVRDTAQQERQVEHISHVVDEMAGTMKSVSERAEKVSLNTSRQILRNNDTMGKSMWKIEEKEGTYDSPNHFTPIR